MAVGVTTFISGSLAGGKRFSIGGSLSGRKGLKIGRATDMLVRKVVKGAPLKAGAKSEAAVRAREFFKLMRENGIKVTEVQVRAADDTLGIRTEIDAVGKAANGARTAIELKTSQHTKASFSAAYYTTCKNQPTLTNGLPNCLYWRHQLQAGFAVVASNCTRAVVAVMCADGGLVYDVKDTACSRAMFQGAAGEAEVRLRAPLLPYPEDADGDLLTALRNRMKYNTVVSHRPTIVRSGFGDAVLLLVHKGKDYAATKVAVAHRELARILARKHSAAAVIGWLHDGKWRFETVVKRPSAVAAISGGRP